MSTTQIPPKDLPSATPVGVAADNEGFYDGVPWEAGARLFDVESFPHALVQLQNELDRSRRREALWLSLILHLTIAVLIVDGPSLVRFLPRHNVVMVAPVMPKDKELTYLELPPDAQKLAQPPRKTDIISDKNRIATSKSPQL